MAKSNVNIAKGLGRGVEIAEEIRNEKSANNLFAGIFTGNPPLKKVLTSWPKPSQEETVRRDQVVGALTDFLIKKVDPYLIDNTASVPLGIFQGLADLGSFGLKVDPKFGGKGLSNTSYLEVLGLSASWHSAIVIVLSADNTIGCKFPVMYYGTEQQKDYFLPKLVKWPTGFCLTEKDVGSDASKIRTYAVRVKDGSQITGYRITGKKWFTTNGILNDGDCLAKYLAVIARIVDNPLELDDKSKKECFGLFIVPTDTPGFDIGTRNTFIGMRGIHNSNPRFDNVFVPEFNLIGERRIDWEQKYGWGQREGSGLKIAFESLNTGRIAIAKGCIGVSKQALNITRWWAKKRNQLGGPLADKELVRDKIVYAASNILAMEAMTKYASTCFDNGEDVRLESAAVKIFASEKAWQIVDNMMQVRGGRGYETWQSLSRRELTPPDDMMWLGSRPNRIFEGANEILVQLIFREGTDRFIKTAMPLMSQQSSINEKLSAIIKMAGYYAKTLAPRNSYVSEASARLARKILITSAKYQNKLAVKQLMLDRFSRIAINLGAITLANAYAKELDKEEPGNNYSELAQIFGQATHREIEDLFKELDDNDDNDRWKVSKRLLNGDFDDFLLEGIIPMTEEHMKGPKTA